MMTQDPEGANDIVWDLGVVKAGRIKVVIEYLEVLIVAEFFGYLVFLWQGHESKRKSMKRNDWLVSLLETHLLLNHKPIQEINSIFLSFLKLLRIDQKNKNMWSYIPIVNLLWVLDKLVKNLNQIYLAWEVVHDLSEVSNSWSVVFQNSI